MRDKKLLAVLLLVGLLPSSFVGADIDPPILVSPGSPQRIETVEARCPTFNWADISEAKTLELVVYHLEEQLAQPVIRITLPGSAHGWTPSLERCLEAGMSYAWTLRAIGERHASNWAQPNLFRVSALPSMAEIRRAVELLRSYPSRGQDIQRRREPAEDQALVEQNHPPTEDSTISSPSSLIEAAAAIHGEGQASEAAAVGVRGVIHGDGAAGVFVSTGEGAILSGSSGEREVFRVDQRGNVEASSFVGGGGGLSNVTAAGLDCSQCVDDADISDRTISNLKIGIGEISTVEISDGFGVFGVDVFDGSLTGADIMSESIYGSDIANGSLTGDDIAPGSIGTSEIENGSLTYADIQEHSILLSNLATMKVVAVECSGNCAGAVLDDICGAFYEPLAVDCDEVRSHSGGTGCGSSDTCFSLTFNPSTDLGDLCGDQNGWDANVYCLAQFIPLPPE